MGLFGKRPEIDAPPVAAPPERPRMTPACTCGSRQFTAGGQSVTPFCDGERAWVEPAGAVLACLHCGKRWYTTPSGLSEPHEGSMPPAWAAMDAQAKVIRAREDQREKSAKDNPPMRSLPQEFRRPPRGR